MGIISRFSDIMKANMNALLDKCEDPEKMIDQKLRELKENLAEVKKDTAEVMAEETRCKRELTKWQDESKKGEDLAKKAITAGKDSDATQFLAKRNSANERVASAQKVFDTAKANSDKMQQMYHKLENDIQILQSKRETLKATVAVAKTQESINRANAKANASKTMDSFGELEDRINKRLDAANAAAELDAQEGHDEVDDLAAQYTNDSKASLDADLAALKAQMGM